MSDVQRGFWFLETNDWLRRPQKTAAKRMDRCATLSYCGWAKRGYPHVFNRNWMLLSVYQKVSTGFISFSNVKKSSTVRSNGFLMPSAKSPKEARKIKEHASNDNKYEVENNRLLLYTYLPLFLIFFSTALVVNHHSILNHTVNSATQQHNVISSTAAELSPLWHTLLCCTFFFSFPWMSAWWVLAFKPPPLFTYTNNLDQDLVSQPKFSGVERRTSTKEVTQKK